MTEIAYTQRIWDDRAEVTEFLADQRVGVLAMVTADGPYAVPVNYAWHDDAIWFHGMGSGRKVDVLRGSPQVCFTVFDEVGTVTDPMPCHADTAYSSVICFGRAQRVTDAAAAADGLQAIVDKFLPGCFASRMNRQLVERYHSNLDGRAVGVFRLAPERITAKHNRAAPAEIFVPSAS